jgi:3-hydroxyacyl-CoA dehydrogenase/enoyl-CoA hydratase/3-hydroxybutyryl-CoA epimerase/enoyl-CoA isomerase
MQSSPLAARLATAGLRGKKGGGGFFRYAQDPRSGRPRKLDWNNVVDAHLSRPAKTQMDTELVRDRLVLALVNEAARCVDERVVATEDELDLATVFGMGFPPFLGGALRYVRARGTAEVVTRLEELAALPDVRQRDGARERFDPAPLLRSLART